MGGRSRRPAWSQAGVGAVILVDSSAWIELLRDTGSPAHRTVSRLLHEDAPLAVTEIVVAEVLAGARNEMEHHRLRGQMLSFLMLSLNGVAGFEQAARLTQACRARGVTPSLTDCLVAGPALLAGAAVLHADTHFEAIAAVTELETYPLDSA